MSSPEEQRGNTPVSREICEEVVEETSSLLDRRGTLLSGVFYNILTYVSIAIALIGLYLSLTKFIQDFAGQMLSPGFMQILKLVAGVLVLIAAWWLANIVSIVLRGIKPSKSVIEDFLLNRKEILEKCEKEICSGEMSKNLLCLDIEKLLKALHMINKSKRERGKALFT